MIKKCEKCQKEFEAKRSTARYCSAACRKLAFLSVPKVSVPDELVETERTIIAAEKELTLADVCSPEEIQNYRNYCETKLASEIAKKKLNL